MSSGLQHAIGDRARGQRDGKHHGAAADHAAAARCCRARSHRSPSDPGPASARARAARPIRDRCDRACPFGATENANRLLKKMSASAISPEVDVDQETGRAEHAIEVWPIDESNGRPAVDAFRRRGGHALKRKPHVRGFDARPRGGGPVDRAKQIGRRHAATGTIGNEIADRLLLPRRVDDASVHRRAKFEVGQRRCRSCRQQERQRQRSDTSHRAATAATVRTLPSNTDNDTGLRRTSPRTIRPVSTTGGTTTISPDIESRCTR